MSDNICPKCKTKNNKNSKFCKKCGYSFNHPKTDIDEVKSNLINFTEEVTSKIQNKLENEDIFNKFDINKIKEDLSEINIIKPKREPDVKSSKVKVTLKGETENKEGKQEPQNKQTPHQGKTSPKVNVCSKCGFENRSNVKFCTNCGNKL